MERRMDRYKQLSPERAKVWTQKSPKYHYSRHCNQHQLQHDRKVPVIYYLCRNRQLEHPHFMEVPLSSSNGLYLKDVIERLNVLRGRGLASMYAWSCKRSYKNGYVWRDLCEDDLILPAHGNEYVLKGSELIEEFGSGRFNSAGTGTFILQNQKAIPEPTSARSQAESSSSSSLNGRTTKSFQDEELSPPVRRPCLLTRSPESNIGKNSSWNGSLSLTEYKVYKSDGFADASTQTDENTIRAVETRDACARGVSTDDDALEPDSCGAHQNQVSGVKQTSEVCRDFVSPPPSTSVPPSSGGRIDTLESLIMADLRRLNNFRIREEQRFQMPSNTKLKASNMIMHLISCGSISVKGHNLGMIPTYKPRFPHSKFPTPLFSKTLLSGEIDCRAENPRPLGMKLEDKEYFSGSLAETSMIKDGVDSVKQSSFNADRTTQQLNSTEDKVERSSTSSKSIPRSIQASHNKQPCESMRSPLSEGPKISSERVKSSRTITPGTSSGGIKRMTEPLSGKEQSERADSSRNDKEDVIKIEES